MSTMSIKEAIDFLHGHADGEDDDLGDACRSVIALLARLRSTGQAVVDSADDAGCQDDLTVASKSAIADLNAVVYQEFEEYKEEDFGEKIERMLEEGHSDEEVIDMLDEAERTLLVSLIRIRREGQ